MGSGDWNDGMNRVGHLGKGESVWVGWFLYTTLQAFAPLCDDRNDQARGDRYREHLEKLKTALAEKGWTETGIAAPISTMAHHWARCRTMNVVSIRLCNRGPSSQAPPKVIGRSAPWRRWKSI